MLKRTIAILLACVMILAMIGCGKQQAPADGGTDTGTTQPASGEKKTLTVWVGKIFSEDANALFEQRLMDFGKEFGIEMKVEMMEEDDFATKFNAAIEAKQLPDVTFMKDDTANNLYPNVPLMDLTDIIPQIEKNTGRKLFESYYKSSAVDGKYYILPLYSSFQPAIYRTDMLEKAGLTEFPDTWDGVVAFARKVSDPDNGFYGLGIGCGSGDNDGGDVMRQILWAYGGGLFDKDGNPNAVTAENAKAFQLYADLYAEGVIPPSAPQWDGGGNNKSYLGGESAIVFNAFTLKAALAEPGYEDLAAQTGYAVMPDGPRLAAIFGYSITNTCKDVDSAVKLLEYISDKTWYNAYVQSVAPVLGPVFVDTQDEAVWKDPVNHIYIENLTNPSITAYGYPCATVLGKVNGAKVNNQNLLNTALQRITVDQMPVEEALQQLQKDMEEAVK